ncbi:MULTISPECIES: tetratricopeptide repeat protein [unclassified Rickettsia]|uniref:tetratricopeptide repeat protein n=1 Tax=unclassified Rickettsia TaxID=114295 RepID=UPI0034D251CF
MVTDDDAAYYNKGLALIKLQKYEEGIENLNKSIKLDPDYPYAYYYNAIALNKIKKPV